ncbi:MAG: efflux RND transporter periplasmic adaptor subunit [Candidatus Solibacter usitatus]|nr:efflux RND transporter periplasmic adaptor subunit [Candidatus Solibacter usitatus]
MKPALLLIAAALALSCGKPDHPPAPASEAALPVRTTRVVSVEAMGSYEASGTVRARTTTVLSSKAMGYVREVKVQAGDRVRAGDLLVMLDARDLETGQAQAEAALREARSALPEAAAGIAAAQAGLELSQATLRRIEDLLDKKSVSRQEFDEAQARRRVAAAQHEMAVAKRSQVESRIRQAEEAVKNAAILRGYAEIRAPFAGLLTERRVEPGSLAAPGTPLLTIEQPSYRLEASVEESRLASIRGGQAVKVVLDALAQTFTGQVSEIVPAIDAASRSFVVKIDLPAAPALRSGIFGRARFPSAPRQALWIPAGALAEQGQVESVFVVEDGAARTRLVTTGGRAEGRIEILSGLGPSDRVISPRPAGLRDGRKVKADGE